MNQIIVVFKNDISYDRREQHAIIDICNVFGYQAPWFNDDAWLDYDDKTNRTMIIGCGYNDENVKGRIAAIERIYGDCIQKIKEECE